MFEEQRRRTVAEKLETNDNAGFLKFEADLDARQKLALEERRKRESDG